MKSEHIQISGMSCNHCVMAVKKELGKITGLRTDDVVIGSASVTYDESLVRREQIGEAVRKAGYAIV
jgi:copper chaperone